jgi:threonine/homoserine/homoserine lactone efflux protein
VPAPHTLLVFALVAAAFVAVPGPSNLYVLTRGLQSGSRAAVAGAAGCATGAYVYVAATAAGLAALPASSHVVFAVVHYAGAAYLCWLGIAALRSRGSEVRRTSGPRSPWRSYLGLGGWAAITGAD